MHGHWSTYNDVQKQTVYNHGQQKFDKVKGCTNLFAIDLNPRDLKVKGSPVY